jgi:FKBP-type peptidyl-prolyl cis-trans isomerase
MNQFTPITKDKGVYKKVLKSGEGDTPKNGDTVTVAYKGIFEDGTLFDEAEGMTFEINDNMIPGLEIGVKTMRPGEKTILVIRYDYAFGEKGHEHIPPKASLIFMIDLIEIEESG